jgi:hypothetical protein
MKLIQATVKGQPREVNTKYGQRTVMDCLTPDGLEVTVWRNAGDREVLGRRNGERVTLGLDSKGKYSLVETASTHLVDPYAPTTAIADRLLPTATVPVKPVAPAVADTELETVESFLSPERKREIAGYVTQMADLFNFCLSTVDQRVQNIESEDRRAIATTLYLSAQKQFGL